MKKELGKAAVSIHADKETVIELAKDEKLDVDKVESLLKKLKVKHKGIERDDDYLLG